MHRWKLFDRSEIENDFEYLLEHIELVAASSTINWISFEFDGCIQRNLGIGYQNFTSNEGYFHDKYTLNSVIRVLKQAGTLENILNLDVTDMSLSSRPYS